MGRPLDPLLGSASCSVIPSSLGPFLYDVDDAVMGHLVCISHPYHLHHRIIAIIHCNRVAARAGYKIASHSRTSARRSRKPHTAVSVFFSDWENIVQ